MSGPVERSSFARQTRPTATSWHDASRAPAAPAPTRDTGLHLVVDRIRCDGFGMCAELLPELVELDDWGYPIVVPGAVPDELLDHARRAVAVCPVLALRLGAAPRATMPGMPVPAPVGAPRGG